MADGSIIFRTELDNKQLAADAKKAKEIVHSIEKEISDYEKKLNDASNKRQKATEKFNKASSDYSAIEKKRDNLQASEKPLADKAEQLKAEIYNLQKEAEYQKNMWLQGAAGADIDQGIALGKLQEAQAEYDNVYAKLQRISEEIDKENEKLRSQGEIVNDTRLKMQQTESAVEIYTNELNASKINLEAAKEKAGALALQLAKSSKEADKIDDNTKKSSKAMQELEKRTRRMWTRMREIVSGALFFNIISRSMTMMVQWMGNVIKTNSEATASIAQLKGALLTLAQPILNVVIPAFVTLVNVLTRVVSAIASVVSRLFGTTAQNSAEAAEKLNQQANAYGGVASAAKEAQKSIMGFDELNTLQGNTETAGGGGGGSSQIPADFSAVLDAEMQEKADSLVAILSGAAFALGAVLAFSGANIPLGIGMMAIGALGMYSVASLNWDSLSNEVKGAITKLLAILGVSLLAIGAVLAFSGANIPLGIGMMALGATSLASAVVLNWDYITNNISIVIATILGLIGTALLVIGALLLFSGVNPVLGFGLMIAGGLSLLGAGAALDWDYAKGKLIEVWAAIKSWFLTNVAPKLTIGYWQEKLNVIGEAAGKIGDAIQEGLLRTFDNIMLWFDDFLQGFVEGLQWLIDQVAKAASYISMGQAYQNGYVAPASASPYAASVAAASIPQLASGAVIPPNKEFLAVLGDQNSGTNIEAPLATIEEAVARVTASSEQLQLLQEQNDLLRQILSRTGVYLDGREITNTVNKYQRQMARANGV